MKIIVKGRYQKETSLWMVEVEGLDLQASGKTPVEAFQQIQVMVQKDLGGRAECAFHIHDNGHFNLTIASSDMTMSYVSQKINERNLSYEEISRILTQITFIEDLEEQE